MLFCKIILSKFPNSSFRHLDSIPLLKSSHSLGQSLFSAFGTTLLERTVGRLLNKAGTEDCMSLTSYFDQLIKEERNPPHQIHFRIYSPHQQRWLLLVWWPKNKWKKASTISANIPYHWRTAWHKTQSLWSGRSRPLPPSPTLTGSTRSGRLWDHHCMWRLPSPQRQWAP